jgi:hypothetical protein
MSTAPRVYLECGHKLLTVPFEGQTMFWCRRCRRNRREKRDVGPIDRLAADILHDPCPTVRDVLAYAAEHGVDMSLGRAHAVLTESQEIRTPAYLRYTFDAAVQTTAAPRDQEGGRRTRGRRRA